MLKLLRDTWYLVRRTGRVPAGRLVVFLTAAAAAMFLMAGAGYAQTGESAARSIVFGWNTAGDHMLLARKAAALGKLKGDDGVAVSLGSLFGPERIVEYDEGEVFLRTAGMAGYDYLIPGRNEFMFGYERLRRLRDLPGVPLLLTANIVDEDSRRSIGEPYVVLNINGIRVCLVGFSDRTVIRELDDELVRGVDIVTPAEAMEDIWIEIAGERPDLVVAVGRLRRDDIVEIVGEYDIFDAFVTNEQEGFRGETEMVRAATFAGNPLFTAPMTGDRLGRLVIRETGGDFSYEFADIVLSEDVAPDPDIAGRLEAVLDELARRDRIESVYEDTGEKVAETLQTIFDVDAVFIERQSLYYFPLEDSLTVLNVEKVIKPYNVLKTFSLTGERIKSILVDSQEREKPEEKLHYAGITSDAKIDSIPIQDQRTYRILTTTFLSLGGHDYEQFTAGEHVTGREYNMLEAVQSYLVARDEWLREAGKPKYWTLQLGVNIGSNLNRIDVDSDKSLYGSDIPKPFRSKSDQFSGNIVISSQNNIFTYKRNRHDLFSKLKLTYIREGYREGQGDVAYREAGDTVELYNKYTYHLNYTLDPYVDLNLESELYLDPGQYEGSSKKHPLVARMGSGLTRTFDVLWGLDMNLGVHGTRNYLTNENSFGTYGKARFDKSFPEDSIVRRIGSDTSVTWDPMQQYNMAFFMNNTNYMNVRLWRNINMEFRLESYAYRSTKHRKIATGFVYFALLNYGMDWKF